MKKLSFVIFIAVFLVLTFVCGVSAITPLTANAASGTGTENDPIIVESYAELKTALEQDTPTTRYIKLGSDVYASDYNPNNVFNCSSGTSVDVYLDLAGHTIERSGYTETALFNIGDNYSLTINDSVGDGEIKSSYNLIESKSLYYTSGTTSYLTINAGKHSIEDKTNNELVHSCVRIAGGHVLINGGSFSAKTYAINQEHGSLEIYGGTFQTTAASCITSYKLINDIISTGSVVTSNGGSVTVGNNDKQLSYTNIEITPTVAKAIDVDISNKELTHGQSASFSVTNVGVNATAYTWSVKKDSTEFTTTMPELFEGVNTKQFTIKAVGANCALDGATVSCIVTFGNGQTSTVDKTALLEIAHQTTRTFDSTNHWWVCDDCGMETEKDAHTYQTYYTGDAYNHFKACACGARSQEGAHNDGNDDGYCDICNLTMFVVTFDSNGGTGSMASVKVCDWGNWKLPECTITAPTGKEFKAWQIGDKEYAVGDEVEIYRATTLIALWKEAGVPTLYQVIYQPGDTNGNNESIEYEANQTITFLDCEELGYTREGFEFDYWSIRILGDNLTEVAQKRPNETYTLTTDIIAVAMWKELPHVHTYDGTYQYDDEYHWKQCSDPFCPDLEDSMIETAFHVPSNATCVQTGTCFCGKSGLYGECDYSSGVYVYYDAQYHVEKCKYCASTNSAYFEHTGGTATCTEKAVCSDCMQAYGTTNENAHSGTLDWIKTATTHQKKYTCCGDAVVAEEAHEWNNGVCSECEYVCLHTNVAVTKKDGQDATCTVDGYKDYYQCACGKLFADENSTMPIDNLDTWKANDGKIVAKHTYGNLIPEESAVHTTTELKAGLKAHYYCSVCETYFDENKVETTLLALTIAKPEHVYGDFITSDSNEHWKQCTCGLKSELGDHVYTDELDTDCNTCGRIKNSVHVHGNGVKQDGKTATCTENGWHDYYKCICNQLFADVDCTIEITALEDWKNGDGKIRAKHEYGDLIEEVKATCSATGKQAHYHCSVCGTFFNANQEVKTENELTISIDANAHTYGAWTSNSNGTHTRVCSLNGEHKETADCSGGTATCTEKAICEHCNTAYGDTAQHNHGTTWESDANNHWNECSCGDKANIGTHANSDSNGKCDTCDYQMGNGGAPTPDEPKDGLSGGAIAGIVVGLVVVLGLGGFALVWFAIKKKSFADLVAIFKKK